MRVTGGECGLALPAEILKEVFLSLPTVDQQRCRRTCLLWDAILTSGDEWKKHVRIRVEDPGAWDYDHPFIGYGCIFKHITPFTRTFCLEDPEANLNCAYPDDLVETNEALNLVKNVLDDAGIRVDRLILKQRKVLIHLSELTLRVFFAEMAALFSSLASCCDRLILKQYRLNYRCRVTDNSWEFLIPSAVFVPGSVDDAQSWDVFEKHLSLCCVGRKRQPYQGHWCCPPVDIPRMASCLANLINSRERASTVKKIRWYHGSDRQTGNTSYSGREYVYTATSHRASHHNATVHMCI
ncbi:uncharacterized protein LOC129602102 isoform X2 [Paramacrobiotus metropolitanus]|uniref:uncharacterized protein LOC129602102 isoform X2 n=1 Tax=Paramacrobiotus metropolitanus TaxID=2943436 RepID=UPI002445AB72|nr:uncharacterized protein LOC129602102 isoform X2 [Paramacrobiotus metropolitanus]